MGIRGYLSDRTIVLGRLSRHGVRRCGGAARSFAGAELRMIGAADARTVVDHALEHARRNGFPPMTVAVLDAAGSLLAYQREDGSSLLRERIARGKAMGALNLGVGSRSLASRAADHPHFVAALIELSGGGLVPVPGGVLVRRGEAIVGAVGVSGHEPDADEQCAVAAIEHAGLTADPGA
ncbi:MAG: hypothetical protein QOE86_912 [Solirubrobacteraceae bacterium]|jgi:uncharacterized protein GlcG (DUF336 family)|nr:hypothetical protein [Solirubrobacteraceae bacterium]